jgi:hypothetical protein
MGTFIEFAEILEKKIRKEIERDGHPQTPSEDFRASSKIHSELWTHLVGQMDAHHFQNPHQGQAYHRLRPAPRPRPDHQLSTEQSKALMFFAKHGQDLAANFSSADLKRSFRALALKLHPDQGGSSLLFQTLVQAREQLQALF